MNVALFQNMQGTITISALETGNFKVCTSSPLITVMTCVHMYTLLGPNWCTLSVTSYVP